MEEKNYNYSEKAAEWWANKVRNKMGDNVPVVHLFKNLLEKEIKILNSQQGSLTISTYHTNSLLLENVARMSKLPVELPKGYEMKIFVDSVFVYDYHGDLVASF